MKFRVLALLVGAVLAGAIGGWYWFEHANDKGALEFTANPESPVRTQPSAPDAAPSSATSGNKPGPPSEPAAAPSRSSSSVAPGFPMTRGTPTPPPGVAAATPAPVRPPTARGLVAGNDGRDDLENVQSMFRNFRTRLKENPVGTNAEIMKAVMGGNPVNAQLGPPAGQSLNEQGELVDRWGTPYFFHQLSRDQMEVRSAGPDRVLWNADDLVAK